MTLDVFQKGDVTTPQRFWEYALRTESKHARFYDSIGFVFSEKHTQQFKEMSEEERKRVKFDYINGVKQY